MDRLGPVSPPLPVPLQTLPLQGYMHKESTGWLGSISKEGVSSSLRVLLDAFSFWQSIPVPSLCHRVNVNFSAGCM